MKLNNKIITAIISLAVAFRAVDAKGGHGGGHGKGGTGKGGSEGGHTTGGRSSVSGSFKNGSPPSYASSGRPFSGTKAKFHNYVPVNNNLYRSNPDGSFGVVGNPSFWPLFIVSSGVPRNYDDKYGRYNGQTGYYFAPQVNETVDPSGKNVSFTETAHSDDINYMVRFNTTIVKGVPVDFASFYATSDDMATPADFYIGTVTAGITEFNDTNGNGFLDNNEPVLVSTSFEDAVWSPFVVTNKTVPVNSSDPASLTDYYLEMSATATGLKVNGTGLPFSLVLDCRVSNLQLNNTGASLNLQPNSKECELQVQGYSPVYAGNQYPYTRRALIQAIITTPNTDITYDIPANMTSNFTFIEEMRVNTTLGITIGNYSEIRKEYLNTASITDLGIGTGSFTTDEIKKLIQGLYASDILGSSTPNNLTIRMISVTIGDDAKLSSFDYLDTDVLNYNSGTKVSFTLPMALLILVATVMNFSM